MAGIGLCLSGGGARGLAHLGVLKALDELEVPIEMISGTSAGAIAGSMYAAGLSPETILEKVRTKSVFDVFKLALGKSGLSEMKYLRNILVESCGDLQFSDLKIPFVACLADLRSGMAEMISEGDLVDAVIASASIPIIFEPVEKDGKLYVDGGVLNNLPVEPLLEKNLKIIGVNINVHGESRELPNKMKNVAERIFDLTLWYPTKKRFEKCDVQIDVTEAFTFGLFEFNKGDELFEIGYRATMKQKDEIQKLISEVSS
ncbi:MAG: patatin-like phospholipase family protein [Cryomorphaceae bacterium]|nr:patatin-like phospholipase family protein [Cryomorphaceae bacterium]